MTTLAQFYRKCRANSCAVIYELLNCCVIKIIKLFTNDKIKSVLAIFNLIFSKWLNSNQDLTSKKFFNQMCYKNSHVAILLTLKYLPHLSNYAQRVNEKVNIASTAVRRIKIFRKKKNISRSLKIGSTSVCLSLLKYFSFSRVNPSKSSCIESGIARISRRKVWRKCRKLRACTTTQAGKENRRERDVGAITWSKHFIVWLGFSVLSEPWSWKHIKFPHDNGGKEKLINY